MNNLVKDNNYFYKSPLLDLRQEFISKPITISIS